MEPNMDTESGKTECYHRYVGYGILPGCEDVQRLRDLRGKATFKLLRGAKRSGTGMIDIGMIIEDLGQGDESVGVPFKKALDSLRGSRHEISSELHKYYRYAFSVALIAQDQVRISTSGVRPSEMETYLVLQCMLELKSPIKNRYIC